MMTEDPDIITLGQAAAILQVCRETCVKYIEQGLIKAGRIGESGPYRVSKQSILEYLSFLMRKDVE